MNRYIFNDNKLTSKDSLFTFIRISVSFYLHLPANAYCTTDSSSKVTIFFSPDRQFFRKVLFYISITLLYAPNKHATFSPTSLSWHDSSPSTLLF